MVPEFLLELSIIELLVRIVKKIIIAALSVILGTFGYTVVDKAIEDRFSNLEAKVSIQQSIIDEFNIDDYDLRLASDMPVGTKMLCIPSEPVKHIRGIS